MTPQEIDRIECAIRHIESSLDVDPWAVDIAVEAMEKQIPKEPKYKELETFAKNRFITITLCPNCNREIVAGDMHCIGCGQRISWEE